MIYLPSSRGGLQCAGVTMLISSLWEVTWSVLVSQHLGIIMQQLLEARLRTSSIELKLNITNKNVVNIN